MVTLFLHHKKRYLLHAVVWLLWLVYHVLIFSQFDDELDYIENYLAFFVVHLGLFYVHAYWVMNLLTKHQWLFYLSPIILFAEFALYFLMFIIISLLFGDLTFDGWEGPLFEVANVTPFVQPFLSYLLAASLYAVLENKLLQNIEWKSRLLRRTIGLHFLTNYLSTMYKQLRLENNPGAKAVLLLEEHAAFLLNEKDASPKSIAEELDALKRMLRMEKVRRPEAFSFFLVERGDVRSFELIPIVLLTLAENIFQHGVFLNPDIPAHMLLERFDGGLLIQTRNKVKRSKSSRGRGIALQNLKERLTLYHGGKYELSCLEVNGFFEVSLKVWE